MNRPFLIGANFCDQQWYGAGTVPFCIVLAPDSATALAFAKANVDHLVEDSKRELFHKAAAVTPDPWNPDHQLTASPITMIEAA